MSRLQMIPERAYMEIFRDLVDEYLLEVTEAFPGLLSSAAEAGLELAFWREAKLIAGDTLESMAREIIARENPFAVYDSKLSTKKQKEEAASVVKGMLKSKEKNLPEVLYRVIRSRFRLLANALSEMLWNVTCHRTKIADELFEGREFTRIENISAGAGDYHSYARAAAIIETDCGKMVYKPWNCLTDVRTRIFAQKYFPGSVLIPKCYTDGSSFGVCEYLPADPDPETADPGKWFYALGGLTVLILLLGSSDMHNENIISSGGMPAVIDMETILTPRVETVSGQTSAQEAKPCFTDEIRLSRKELQIVGNHFYIVDVGKQPVIQTPIIDKISISYVRGLRQRCEEDLINGHFDSVITKSRTLMEEILIYVLEQHGKTVTAKGDLIKLYNQVKGIRNMRQSNTFDIRVNDLLSGLEKIVNSIANMRNINSDAHGAGTGRITIREKEARLIMNTAISYCEYMLS